MATATLGARMIDLLYLTWNRRQFTEASFQCLLENTDWSLVDQLIIYDDGSTDGTTKMLSERLSDVPVPARIEHSGRRSPVGAMNAYIRSAGSRWFAKIDNDACVPPGWLPTLLGVIDANPDIDVLGMEAGMTPRPDPGWDGVYRFEPSSHIGGIGLMRTACFSGRRMIARGRYGFGHFQEQQDLRRGWVTPDLPLVLLDRLPFEPWVSLSDLYVECRWQRPWPKWDPVWMRWAYEWFAPDQVEQVA